MIKMIYIAICVLDILMSMELSMIISREAQERELKPIRKVSVNERIVALIKSALFWITPILNLFIFISLIFCYTEAGREAFLDKMLENYE